MRILHVSHGRIPDSRIEKVATHFKSQGHELIFMGLKKCGGYIGPFVRAFSQDYGGITNYLFDLGGHVRLRTQIKTMRPDLVHFHDVNCAAFLNKIDTPIVFDDHEYLSRQLELEPLNTDTRRKAYPKMLVLRELWRYRIINAERKLLRHYPTVVTNERVRVEYEKRNPKWIGVVENVPARYQVGHIDYTKYDRRGCVYIGQDSQLKHRTMTGLNKHVDFTMLYGLLYKDMMQELTKYEFGLVPWKHHPTLYYKNQNKGYEYMHAGCQLIISKQLEWQYEKNLPWIHTIDSYDEISTVIKNAPDISPLDIVEYAREHYLWDDRADVYEEAYRVALA